MSRLVAVDWGTSSLRGALLGEGGAVLEERSFARGILSVPPGGFAAVFDECFGEWMRAPSPLALVCGMAGSKQGWVEAPYCACPAGFAEVAQQLAWIERGARRIAIVPGLSCEREGAGGLPSIPDVMRGEETQVFGAAGLLGLRGATLVLPGTHSKWVQLRAGKIERFSTFMTGEFYALLRQHSILSRTLPATDPPLDEGAFGQGLAVAADGPGLLHNAFSARTLSLFSRMGEAALASYLSGLLIGEELRAAPLGADGGEVVLVGAPALTARYALALSLRNIANRSLGSEAAWHGLHLMSGVC